MECDSDVSRDRERENCTKIEMKTRFHWSIGCSLRFPLIAQSFFSSIHRYTILHIRNRLSIINQLSFDLSFSHFTNIHLDSSFKWNGTWLTDVQVNDWRWMNYLLWLTLSTPADCGASYLCSTTRNCIWCQPKHLKIVFHRRSPSMGSLYLVLGRQMVDNSPIDTMNLLGPDCPVFQSQYRLRCTSVMFKKEREKNAINFWVKRRKNSQRKSHKII